MSGVDTPTTTRDPVSLVDIAARCGVTANRVNGWSSTGLLPEPDWTVAGKIPVWAWETVQRCRIIATHLGIWDWEYVWDAVPERPGDGYVAFDVTQGQWTGAWRRIERRSIGAVGCGWISWPREGGWRTMITDATTESGVPMDRAGARRLFERLVAEYPEFRKTGDRREPKVSKVWLPDG